MTFPPPPLTATRTNSTPQLDSHPADHNSVALAINDIVANQSIDAYANVIIPGNTDTAAFGYTDWLATAVPVPTWARAAYLTTTVSGIFQQSGSVPTVWEFTVGLGPNYGQNYYRVPNQLGIRDSHSWTDRITPLNQTGAAVPIRLLAKIATGGGVLRADTLTTCRWTIRFQP